MKVLIIAIASGALFLTGCLGTQTQTPRVEVPTTGSEITDIWEEYDKFAKENNTAELTFVSTSKKIEKNDAKDITSDFTDSDKLIYILTRWKNVEDNAKYEAKIYTPQGKLFKQHIESYRFSSGKWNLWVRVYLKGFPASEIPGNWTAKIYMNSKLAYEKSFTISSMHEERKVNFPYNSIGFLPFCDSKISERKHSRGSAEYMAQKFISTTNVEVKIPSELVEDINLSNIAKDNYLQAINNDLKSRKSSILELMESHNLNYIITGKATDTGKYGQAKTIRTFLIERETKSVKEIATTYYSSVEKLDNSSLEIRKRLYNKMFNDVMKNLNLSV